MRKSTSSCKWEKTTVQVQMAKVSAGAFLFRKKNKNKTIGWNLKKKKKMEKYCDLAGGIEEF